MYEIYTNLSRNGPCWTCPQPVGTMVKESTSKLLMITILGILRTPTEKISKIPVKIWAFSGAEQALLGPHGGHRDQGAGVQNPSSLCPSQGPKGHPKKRIGVDILSGS